MSGSYIYKNNFYFILYLFLRIAFLGGVIHLKYTDAKGMTKMDF